MSGQPYAYGGNPSKGEPAISKQNAGGEEAVSSRKKTPTGTAKGAADAKRRHREAIKKAITIRNRAMRPLKRG